MHQAYNKDLEGEGLEFPNNTPRTATEAAADCRTLSASLYLAKTPWKDERSKSASLKYEATSQAASIASSLIKSKTARKQNAGTNIVKYIMHKPKSDVKNSYASALIKEMVTIFMQKISNWPCLPMCLAKNLLRSIHSHW